MVLVLAGTAVMAAATLAGAWLANRGNQHRQMWFGAAAGTLLVIALVHLLPDAWHGAGDSGLPAWLVPVVAATSFVVNRLVSRVGCTCQADEEHASGAWSAAALGLHRFLEGAALALSGFLTAVALAAHAFGEGMSVAALLRGYRRRLAAWLAVMCIGPAVGAAAVAVIPALDIAEPLLLAVAVGVLAQAAVISLRSAFPSLPARRRITPGPALAMLVAASLTALAVYGVG